MIYDDEFPFKGFHGCESKCGLEILHEGDKATVTLTELPDNPGTSVTNAVEIIATEVYKRFLPGLPPENIRWIEHYPARGDSRDPLPETFDEVTLSFDGQRYHSPKWTHIKAVV